MPDLLHWLALSLVPEIGTVTFRKLLSVYGGPAEVFQAPLGELSALDGIGERKARNIKDFTGWDDVEKHLAMLERINAGVVTYRSPDYPTLLRQTENPPVLLFVRGAVKEDDRFAIAVVGSRRPTHYGRAVTEKLASDLAASGFTVVSGLARGIDTMAHASTVATGGRTLAVLRSA